VRDDGGHHASAIQRCGGRAAALRQQTGGNPMAAGVVAIRRHFGEYAGRRC